MRVGDNGERHLAVETDPIGGNDGIVTDPLGTDVVLSGNVACGQFPLVLPQNIPLL